ncbi:MAG: hypothetical protein U1D30_11600 [Planctomycetota bacterium]
MDQSSAFTSKLTAESLSSRVVFDLSASTESVELREVMVSESEPGAEYRAESSRVTDGLESRGGLATIARRLALENDNPW